ncbi:MAG: alpha/beta hydrolase [Bdellovibrionales bacterium]|nr:alpha/beta hydrolase [Bdellovibrionales bacterium]
MTKRVLIMALHGAGLQGGFYGALAPHMTDVAFKAVTLPGHDVRKNESLLENIAAMALWLRGQLDDLPAEYDVVLLGHSMGSLAVLEAAAHARVRAAVLTGAGAAMPVNPDLLQTAQDDPAAAGAQVAKWGVFRYHPQAEALRNLLIGYMAEVPSAAIGCDLAACDAYQNGGAAAAQVQKPVLVLTGEADIMTPMSGAQTLCDLLPQGSLAIVAEAGHMLPLEKPLETAKEIKDFLRECGILPR